MSIARTATLSIAAISLAGCASRTQIQLRDADTKEVIVGESIGKKGPLHLAHRWWLTDTNGAAYIRVPRRWETLDIVVGGGEDRIDARGTLHANSGEWTLLTPEPSSNRRIEALLVSGEGAPRSVAGSSPQSHD
ncbi:MAG TPA: hypothetical protein VHC70_06810 [Phycisphaerales bacterium]|jgi:hypothetical protein|nr:hypothetical protein [Phycisphaerales bacterium]